MATITLPDHILHTATQQATLTGITTEQWITHAINAHALPTDQDTDYLMDDMGFPSRYALTVNPDGTTQITALEHDKHTTHPVTAQGY